MGKVIRKSTPLRARFDAMCDVLDGADAKVGWFESAKYADGTPAAYIASIMEFGYPEGGIPSRSFLRATITERQGEWSALFKKGAQGVLSGSYTVEQVFKQMGNLARGDVDLAISSLHAPALAASTIAARRRPNRRRNGASIATTSSEKPLHDTGYMQATLTYTTSFGS